LAAGLHREGDWNEAHNVMPVSQDCDSSGGTAAKHIIRLSNNRSLMEY